MRLKLEHLKPGLKVRIVRDSLGIYYYIGNYGYIHQHFLNDTYPHDKNPIIYLSKNESGVKEAKWDFGCHFLDLEPYNYLSEICKED